MHLKELEKEEQMNGKNNTDKSGNKWNNTNKIIEKINENKSIFFEKINKIHPALLAGLTETKKERKKVLINKIKNERGEITMDTKKHERLEKNTINKLESQAEMNKFSESHNLPRLNQEKIEKAEGMNY